MCGIVEYLNEVVGGHFKEYPAATIILGGLTVIGFFHFSLNFLSYFNMLGDLFVRPPTDVS